MGFWLQNRPLFGMSINGCHILREESLKSLIKHDRKRSCLHTENSNFSSTENAMRLCQTSELARCGEDVKCADSRIFKYIYIYMYEYIRWRKLSVYTILNRNFGFTILLLLIMMFTWRFVGEWMFPRCSKGGPETLTDSHQRQKLFAWPFGAIRESWLVNRKWRNRFFRWGVC